MGEDSQKLPYPHPSGLLPSLQAALAVLSAVIYCFCTLGRGLVNVRAF